MKKLCALALCLALCVGLLPSAAWAAGPEVKAKAVLLMEKSTGEILYEEHGEEPLELASVTKVMTMLLIMEALEDGTLTPDTMVAVSANAAGMGGSQVYMKEGETFSVHDMLKAIAVASGNDACVAMAEHLAGSEAAFVERMNARAAELGMENTVFCNCTGLPAEGHHSTAHDIALMSRELIRKHPDIRTYTTIWMDTLRDGTFQLAWKIARPNAVISLLAMYEEDQVLPLPSMYGKNLTWKSGGVDACKDAYLVQLISEGKLDPTPLFNKEYTLNEIAQVYEDFAVKRDGLIKPVIKPYEY